MAARSPPQFDLSQLSSTLDMPVVDISINLDGAQRRQESQGRPAKRAREPGQAKDEGQGEERRGLKGTILNAEAFMIQFFFV